MPHQESTRKGAVASFENLPEIKNLYAYGMIPFTPRHLCPAINFLGDRLRDAADPYTYPQLSNQGLLPRSLGTNNRILERANPFYGDLHSIASAHISDPRKESLS